MTTCELCGDTGLYSPSAVPCPKGCEVFEEPHAPPLRRNVDLNTWEQVIDLFRNNAMKDPPTRLRDEIVMFMEWAWYGQKSADLITNMRAYISDLEQREKDARAKALEDAAKVAESWKAMPCNPQRHFGHRDAACAISAVIRALKDEVR